MADFVAEDKAELRELLRLQDSRTLQQVEHVRGDDRRTVERFLGGMGIKLDQLRVMIENLIQTLLLPPSGVASGIESARS